MHELAFDQRRGSLAFEASHEHIELDADDGTLKLVVIFDDFDTNRFDRRLAL